MIVKDESGGGTFSQFQHRQKSEQECLVIWIAQSAQEAISQASGEVQMATPLLALKQQYILKKQPIGCFFLFYPVDQTDDAFNQGQTGSAQRAIFF